MAIGFAGVAALIDVRVWTVTMVVLVGVVVVKGMRMIERQQLHVTPVHRRQARAPVVLLRIHRAQLRAA